MVSFDKSIVPSLAGRTVLITGGTGGVGEEIVIELSKHNPGQIIFTGRNVKAAESVIKRAQATAPGVAISFIPCDLANLASVQQAAHKILEENSRLDVFLANAGILSESTAYTLTADGYEAHIGTNHVGHALLTRKLLPLLEKTADLPHTDVRIIYTSSTVWQYGNLPFDRFRATKGPSFLSNWRCYSNSKLSNLLYARELAHRYPKILSFSVTPGVVGSSMVKNLALVDRAVVWASQLGQVLTPEEGSYNHLWAVSTPRGSIQEGAFYEPVGRLSRLKTSNSKDPAKGEQLWEWTEKELEKWLV